MAMMVFLLLLLLEISIPSAVECSALSQLLHFLCILGHERIGFSWGWGPCVDGRGLVFVGDHKAFLHRPSINLLLRLLDKWLSLKLVAQGFSSERRK